MKHIFFIIAMGVLSNIHGQMIDLNTALQVAGNYFSQATGRSNVTMVVDETSSKRSDSPLYYVCNSSDGKGYVIVAGTMASTPILAYSPDHSFEMTESTPEVIKYWMRGYEEALAEMISKRIPSSPQITGKWEVLTSGTYRAQSGSQVGPLLRTLWDQNFNAFCPSNAPAGCMATAMAQIMRYWSYPVSGSTFVTDVDNDASDGISGTFSDWVGGDYYDWDNMPVTGILTNTQTMEISELMYHCGIAANMNYGLSTQGGSGTFETDVENAFKNYFGYSSCYVDHRDPIFDGPWDDKIRDELSLGRPVLYCGVDKDQKVGHAWVCDGYDGDLYHMNWGWGEGYNDYYSLDGNFNLDGSHFDDGQCVIMGIEPPGCSAFYEGEFPIILGLALPLEMSDYIHITGGTIESGTAILNAGMKIVLEPGCSVLEGVYANFYLEGCNGESFQGDDVIEVRSTQVSTTVVVEGLHEDLIIAPNPFSYSTNFQYILSARHEVSITVLNSGGTVVATLVERQSQDAGEYNYTFDAFDLPAGLYVVVLQKDGERIAKRMVLTK